MEDSLTFLNVLRVNFISREKSGHVVQKEDVRESNLTMLLICDLPKSE